MTRNRGPQLSRRAFMAATAALVTAGPIPTSAELAQNQPLQVWFIRHAESEINVTPSPRPVPDSGVTYPLTKKGVEQAKALAETLGSAPVIAIYTSTQLRAIQTADALAFRHNLTLSLAPEAVEIDLGVKFDSTEDVRVVYAELARKWLIDKDIEFRHGEGENFAEVQRRFLPFVRELMNRHAHDTGVIVIVAHAATLGFMVPVLANNIPAAFALRHPLPNAGIIKTKLSDSRLVATEWAGIRSADFGE